MGKRRIFRFIHILICCPRDGYRGGAKSAMAPPTGQLAPSNRKKVPQLRNLLWRTSMLVTHCECPPSKFCIRPCCPGHPMVSLIYKSTPIEDCTLQLRFKPSPLTPHHTQMPSSLIMPRLVLKSHHASHK